MELMELMELMGLMELIGLMELDELTDRLVVPSLRKSATVANQLNMMLVL